MRLCPLQFKGELLPSRLRQFKQLYPLLGKPNEKVLRGMGANTSTYNLSKPVVNSSTCCCMGIWELGSKQWNKVNNATMAISELIGCNSRSG